jgi:hypothetical protein
MTRAQFTRAIAELRGWAVACCEGTRHTFWEVDGPDGYCNAPFENEYQAEQCLLRMCPKYLTDANAAWELLRELGAAGWLYLLRNTIKDGEFCCQGYNGCGDSIECYANSEALAAALFYYDAKTGVRVELTD